MNGPESPRFDGVPFAFEWLRPATDWSSGLRGLVLGAGAGTDWFVDPVSGRRVLDAPVLVGLPPAGDFTWEAHVGHDGDDLFDAAGLFVYHDEDHWAKLALEVTSAGPTIVSVVTDTYSDDCNSIALAEQRARLRVARLGEAIAFHVSDGAGRWELVRVFRQPGSEANIGFICQAPTGRGCTGTFEAIAFARRTLGDLRDGS